MVNLFMVHFVSPQSGVKLLPLGEFIAFHFRCVTNLGQRKTIRIFIRSDCTFDESRCRDGACISISKVCDGQINCLDGSDELPEFCGKGKSPLCKKSLKRNLIWSKIHFSSTYFWRYLGIRKDLNGALTD